MNGWQKAAVAGWATILTLVVGYAQVCGVACWLGSCVELTRHDESREHSEHPKSHHETPAPSDSDCIAHGHPDSFVQSASLSFPAIDVLGKAPTSAPLPVAEAWSAAAVKWMPIRSHGPPILSVDKPLYLSLSCLRI